MPSSEAMDYLHERIRHAIETQCDANAESSLHTHSVSTADVIKAVKRLQTDKYKDDGIIIVTFPEIYERGRGFDMFIDSHGSNR